MTETKIRTDAQKTGSDAYRPEFPNKPVSFQRKRPGGSAGAGMGADLLFPGAFAETFAGAGFGRPMPVLRPR